MPSGNDLIYVDNELEQLTRALACASNHNFLAACEDSAHGTLQEDLPTVPTPKVFPDPLQQLTTVGINNAFDLSICEQVASTSPKLHDVLPPAAPAQCGAACGCNSCVWLDDIFSSNRRWAKGLSRINPNFFSDMAHEDTPNLLWIGCADSRVVPNRVTGLQPGSLYVHRNVGNVAKPCDPNCMSALEYSVNSLEVNHVVVCGHYGCNAVSAAMKDSAKTAGILNFWVSDIRQLRQQHEEELQELSYEKQVARLCELNVVRQVMNICNSSVVRAAWERGQAVHVHGLIYDVTTGLLKRLVEPVSSLADDFAVRAAAELQQENADMAAAFTAAAQELLVAHGCVPADEGLPCDTASIAASSTAESFARTAAAMQNKGPGTSPPASPRANSVTGAESVGAPVDVQSLHEELAWVRSSEACAVDAAQHLMEQTWALLREKQEMMKKIAEQAETIKWLEERLHFLESESEHLRAAAPTQLIKRYQELCDLPPDALTSDLQEELHLLQGLMALGGQFSHLESPASTPHSVQARRAAWEKIHDFFPHRLDFPHHFGPTGLPTWNYTIEDMPHSLSHLPAKVPSKMDLLDQVSHSSSPKKHIHYKAPHPDPLPPMAPTAVAGDVEKIPAASPSEGTEPDLWYLLGAYSPRDTSKLQQASVSSPSSHSIPPSSILSSSRESGTRSRIPPHMNRTSLDSTTPSTSVHELALDTHSDAYSHGKRMSIDGTASRSGHSSVLGAPISPLPKVPGPVAVTASDASSSQGAGADAADMADVTVATPTDTAASAAMLFPPLDDSVTDYLSEPTSPYVGHHEALEAAHTEAAHMDSPPAVVHQAEDSGAFGQQGPAATEGNTSLEITLATGLGDDDDVDDAVSGGTLFSSTWELPQLPAWLKASVDRLQPEPAAQQQAVNSAASAEAQLASASTVIPHTTITDPTTAITDNNLTTVDPAITATDTTTTITGPAATITDSGALDYLEEVNSSASGQIDSAVGVQQEASGLTGSMQALDADAEVHSAQLPVAQHAAAGPSTFSQESQTPAQAGSPTFDKAATSVLNVAPLLSLHENKVEASNGARWFDSHLASLDGSPSAGVPPSYTSSKTASLPPLPPKRASSSASGRSIRKRVVHKGQLAEVKEHNSKSRRQDKKSSRSHSSRASVVSTVSSASTRSSLDLGSSSSAATALQKMAEELRQLEDSYAWEEDYDAVPDDKPVRQAKKNVKGTSSKNTFGLHTSRKGNRAPSLHGKGKVTFAAPSPTTSYHAVPANIPPLHHNSMTAAIYRHQPSKLSPIQEQGASTSGYVNYDANYDDKPAPAQAASPTVTQLAVNTLAPVVEAQEDGVTPEGARRKQKGGWLGAVGRATLAVAVGVLVKRAV